MVFALRILPVLLVALAFAGCVSVKADGSLTPPLGCWSHFRAPLAVNLPAPVPCANLKSGTTSRSVYVKDWVYSGLSADICEMTLREAMAAGGLKKVYFADYEQRSLLGFVTFFRVTAYGE